MNRFSVACAWTLAAAMALAAAGCGIAERPNNTAPEGFTALFDGKDLAGWKGLVGNPKTRAAMTPEQLAEAQKKADAQMAQHWRSDGGEIVNDGGGPYLCTVKKYRDFELWVDWKIPPKGDSGIYLRGTPQVQIWDPVAGIAAAKVGSGGLYNNKVHASKPLAAADNPTGQWNTFHIRMIGEIVHVELNGKVTVDNVVMENYWDRSRPIYPEDQIELQTHGGQTRFRNIYIREIGDEEACRFLRDLGGEGFRPVFNGKDLDGWQGAVAGYAVEDGNLVCDPKKGGVLLTKQEYADFAVRFEFRLPKGANNGLAIRAPAGFKSSIDGLKIQILDDTDGANKDVKPYQVHGSVYGIAPATPGYLRPAGQWNFEEVIARGPHITVRVNGTTVLDADLSKIEKAPDGGEHPGMKTAKGSIGFMGHGARAEFRNIRVKTLEAPL